MFGSKKKVEVQEKELPYGDENHDTEERMGVDPRQITRRDKIKLAEKGVGCLLVAVALIGLTALFLWGINDKKVWQKFQYDGFTYHKSTILKPRLIPVPTPASVLSLVLSVVAILLKTGFSEGTNIAWWYFSISPQTTAGELHEMWQQGTSTLAAARRSGKDLKVFLADRVEALKNTRDVRANKSKKNLTYVSLAALFIAALPLNSFFLQSAINIAPGTDSYTGNFTFPMAKDMMFPTGTIDSNGTLGAWSALMSNMTAQGLDPISASTAYFPNNTLPFETQCPGTCSSLVNGIGFTVNCSHSRQYYNLTATGAKDQSHQVLSINVTWDDNIPNGFGLDALWKQRPGCQGLFDVMNCRIQFAQVEYNVTMQAFQNMTSIVGGGNSTIVQLTDPADIYFAFSQSGNIRQDTAGFTSSNGQLGTVIYGGLVGYLKQLFESSVDLVYDNNMSQFIPIVQGSFANRALASSAWAPPYFNGVCNESDHKYAANPGSTASSSSSSSSFSKSGYSDYFWTTSQSDYSQNKAYTKNLPGTLVDGKPEFYNHTVDAGIGEQVIAEMQKVMFLFSAYVPLVVQYHEDWAKWSADSEKLFFPWGLDYSNLYQTTSGSISVSVQLYKVVWAWFWAALGTTLLVTLAILPTYNGFWNLTRKTTMSPFETSRAFNAPYVKDEPDEAPVEVLLDHHGHIRPKAIPSNYSADSTIDSSTEASHVVPAAAKEAEVSPASNEPRESAIAEPARPPTRASLGPEEVPITEAEHDVHATRTSASSSAPQRPGPHPIDDEGWRGSREWGPFG